MVTRKPVFQNVQEMALALVLCNIFESKVSTT